MSYETVTVDRREDVGIVTLNRPDRMNAIDDRMAYEWGEAVEELDADPDVGAIVITGAGKAFSAGADFKRFEAEIAAKDSGEGHEAPRPRRDWIEQVRTSKPIVCAINGYCIGAGLTRTLPCDVRIASDRAAFSMRFVKIGIIPEIASTQILAQIVGLQQAADLMLSARTIDSARAAEIGLVLKVVPHEALMDEAFALASEYAENPPQALVETKKLLYANHVEQDISVVVRRELESMQARWGTAENREAVAAFREKRKPNFRALRT